MNPSPRITLDDFQQRTRDTLPISWIRFLVIMLILGAISVLFLYFFQIYFLVILVGMIGIFWSRARLRRLRKVRAWNNFKIPAEVWRVFGQRHPNISTSSYPYIEEGFKDYLAIHLLRKDAYAMPSHSVDALWHILIEEFDAFYQTMCMNFLGYELIHQPHDPLPTEKQRTAQKQQLLNTWQSTCHLHGLNPEKTQILPRLFQIDGHIRWEKGLIFSLPFMIGMYSQMMSSTSDASSTTTTSSCSSSTSSCSSSSCAGSSSSHDSGHSHGSGSDSSSSCSSCSSCGGGGGD
ncbi:hypothetical protein [Acinetobacter nematophilus]|uniref:Uncharacterized protein n=1 Tax=Acinetobacter nematophilus TaxID=2994642 RepID=A0A9X3DTK1_9GAMM|nr:hypothetical protein [Acinetobacter nematophilus]MCX5468274.1 hypothetical protein [Acinetobacter nematophilus]